MDTKEQDFKVFYVRNTETLSGDFKLKTDNYSDDRLNEDTITSDFLKEHYSVLSLIEKLREYIVMDLRKGISNRGVSKLEAMLMSCEAYTRNASKCKIEQTK